MKKETKAVIYGRVSTEDKQDYGRQVHDLTEFAKRNYYSIDEVFTEKISGAKEERPEFKRMLSYVQDNKINTILVTELTRFGRIGVKTRIAVEELAEKGVDIYFHDRGLHTVINGKINTDAMMIVGLLADLAKKELETMKHRIKSGLRFSVNNGGAGTGLIKPYGFKSVNKKLVIDEKESKVIKEIFNKYVNGWGCSKIALHLNKLNIKTKYNTVFADKEIKHQSGVNKKGNLYEWASGTILTILKNPLYKGARQYKGEVFKVDSIIEESTFDRVQLMLTNKINRPTRVIKNDNYFKGIIKCGVCGLPFFMHQRKDIKDKAFRCLSAKLKYESKEVVQCVSPSINIDKLQDTLYLMSFNYLSNLWKDKKADYKSDLNQKVEIKEIELQSIKSNLKKLEKRQSDLFDLYSDGVIGKSEFINGKSKYQLQVDKMKDNQKILLTELDNLIKLKNSPLKVGFNKLQFLNSARDIFQSINITTPNPAQALNYRATDVIVKIAVQPVHGEIFEYIVSRYSNKLTILNAGKRKVSFDYKNSVPHHHMLAPLTNSIDKMIKQKKHV